MSNSVIAYQAIALAPHPADESAGPRRGPLVPGGDQIVQKVTSGVLRLSGACIGMGSTVGPFLTARNWAKAAVVAKAEHSPYFPLEMAYIHDSGRWALGAASAGTALYCAGTLLGGKSRRALRVGVCASAALLSFACGLLYDEPLLVQWSSLAYFGIATFQIVDTIVLPR